MPEEPGYSAQDIEQIQQEAQILLGRLLERLLDEHRFEYRTRQALAERTGISHPTINSLIRGSTRLRAETADEILRRLVDAFHLVDPSEDPTIVHKRKTDREDLYLLAGRPLPEERSKSIQRVTDSGLPSFRSGQDAKKPPLPPEDGSGGYAAGGRRTDELPLPPRTLLQFMRPQPFHQMKEGKRVL